MGEQPARARGLRVGDAERERVAGLLRTAWSEGRLTRTEFEERTARAYDATVVGDLAVLLGDLPAGGSSLADNRLVPHPPGLPEGPRERTVLAVLGSTRRRGGWRAAATLTAVAVGGTVELDLCDAAVAGNALTVTAVAVLGGVTVVVPASWRVSVSGLRSPRRGDTRVDHAPSPAGVHLHLRRYALLGGVRVQRRTPKPARYL